MNKTPDSSPTSSAASVQCVAELAEYVAAEFLLLAN